MKPALYRRLFVCHFCALSEGIQFISLVPNARSNPLGQLNLKMFFGWTSPSEKRFKLLLLSTILAFAEFAVIVVVSDDVLLLAIATLGKTATRTLNDINIEEHVKQVAATRTICECSWYPPAFMQFLSTSRLRSRPKFALHDWCAAEGERVALQDARLLGNRWPISQAIQWINMNHPFNFQWAVELQA